MSSFTNSSGSLFGNTSFGNLSSITSNRAVDGAFFAESSQFIRPNNTESYDGGVEIFDFDPKFNSEDSEIKRIDFGNGAYCLTEEEEIICGLLGEEEFKKIKENDGDYLDVSTMNALINYLPDYSFLDSYSMDEDDGVDPSQKYNGFYIYFGNSSSDGDTENREVAMLNVEFGSEEYDQYIELKTEELDEQEDPLQQMVDLYSDIISSTGFDDSDYKSVSQTIAGLKDAVDGGKYFDPEETIKYLMENNIDPVDFFGKSTVELCKLSRKELCQEIANALNNNIGDIIQLESAINSIEQTKSDLWWTTALNCKDFKNYKFYDSNNIPPKILEVGLDNLRSEEGTKAILACMGYPEDAWVNGEPDPSQYDPSCAVLTLEDVLEIFDKAGEMYGNGCTREHFRWAGMFDSGYSTYASKLKEMGEDPEHPEYKDLYNLYKFFHIKGGDVDSSYIRNEDESYKSSSAYFIDSVQDQINQYIAFQDYKEFYDSLDKDSFSDSDMNDIMEAVQKYQDSSDKPMTYYDLYYALSKFNIEGLDEFVRLINNNAPKDTVLNIDEFSEALDAYEWISDTTSVENYFDTMGEGFKDGIGGFVDGLFGWIENDQYSVQDYKKMYMSQLFSDCLLLDFDYNLNNSIGNMAPSILLSLNPYTAALGKFSFFASAGGASVKNAKLNYGASDASAYVYGILSGMSEVLFERFLGAIPGLSEVKVTGFKTWAKAAIKEGNEELLQNFVDRTLLKQLGIDPNTHVFDVENATEDLQTWLMGAASGGVLNLPSAVLPHIYAKLENTDFFRKYGTSEFYDQVIEEIMNDTNVYESIFHDSAGFESLVNLETRYLLSKEYNFKKMDDLARRNGLNINDDVQMEKFLKLKGYSDATISEYMNYKLDMLVAKAELSDSNDVNQVSEFLKKKGYENSTIDNYIRRMLEGLISKSELSNPNDVNQVSEFLKKKGCSDALIERFVNKRIDIVLKSEGVSLDTPSVAYDVLKKLGYAENIIVNHLFSKGVNDKNTVEYVYKVLDGLVDDLVNGKSIENDKAKSVYKYLKDAGYDKGVLFNYFKSKKVSISDIYEALKIAHNNTYDAEFKKDVVLYKMLESHPELTSYEDAKAKFPDETKQAIRDCHREFVIEAIIDWKLGVEYAVKTEYERVNGPGTFYELSKDDRTHLIDDYKDNHKEELKKKRNQIKPAIDIEYNAIVDRSIAQLEKLCNEKVKVPYTDPVTGETKYSEVKAFKDGVTPEDLLLVAKADVDISQYCTKEYIEARMKHFGATSMNDTVKVYCFQSARNGDNNIAKFGGNLGYDAVYVFSEQSMNKFLSNPKYFNNGVPAALDAMTNFGKEELGGVPLTADGALIIEREVSMRDVILPKGCYSCSYDGYYTSGGFLLGDFNGSSIELKTPEATVPPTELDINSFTVVQESDGFYYLKGTYVEDGVTYNIKMRTSDGTEKSSQKFINNWKANL